MLIYDIRVLCTSRVHICLFWITYVLCKTCSKFLWRMPRRMTRTFSMLWRKFGKHSIPPGSSSMAWETRAPRGSIGWLNTWRPSFHSALIMKSTRINKFLRPTSVPHEKGFATKRRRVTWVSAPAYNAPKKKNARSRLTWHKRTNKLMPKKTVTKKQRGGKQQLQNISHWCDVRAQSERFDVVSSGHD